MEWWGWLLAWWGSGVALVAATLLWRGTNLQVKDIAGLARDGLVGPVLILWHLVAGLWPAWGELVIVPKLRETVDERERRENAEMMRRTRPVFELLSKQMNPELAENVRKMWADERRPLAEIGVWARGRWADGVDGMEGMEGMDGLTDRELGGAVCAVSMVVNGWSPHGEVLRQMASGGGEAM